MEFLSLLGFGEVGWVILPKVCGQNQVVPAKVWSFRGPGFWGPVIPHIWVVLEA